MHSEFAHKKILLLGAGREGISTARYLKSMHPEASITIADSAEMEIPIEEVRTLSGANYPNSLAEWDITIVSPGIPPSTPLLLSAQQITTATNIFFAVCAGTIIAVTGSKGKSTTSSLIADILRGAGRPVHLVGNIGTPALEILSRHNTPEDIFVYELSSYQASRLTEGPDVAVIINLFPEHLDYHGSREQYYRDKLRVTTMQSESNTVMYNAHNTELTQRITKSPAHKVAWPNEHGAHTINNALYYGTEQILPLSELKLPGAHNAENCLAAITVAKYFDIPNNTIATALRAFQPLPHRLQNIGTFHGITFYDDAISTTPESTIAALKTLPNVGALILGGQDRGYDFAALAETIAAKKIPTLIFFPDSGATIQTAIEATGYEPEHILETRSMDEVVQFAYAHTPMGGTCLLSCASPSYSIFKNFEDKGDQFQHYIKERT